MEGMTYLSEKVGDLDKFIPSLKEKDRGFATSLVDGFRKNKKLSSKQEYWVEELLKRAMFPKVNDATESTISGFTKLYAIFVKAKEHLKYPKITLEYDIGELQGKICLSMAGDKSKFPGAINVTNGGRFGDNIWYGRVSEQGVWTHAKSGHPEDKIVSSLLRELGNDPEEVAHNQGHLTGNCCFCHSKLTDEKSTSVGYGLVCAKNFGLSWGGK